MNLRERLTLAIITILVLFSINVGTDSWSNNTRKASIKKLQQAVQGQLEVSSIKQNLDSFYRTVLLHHSLQQTAGQSISLPEITQALAGIKQLQNDLKKLGQFANSTSTDNYQLLWQQFSQLSQYWEDFYRGTASNAQYFDPDHSTIQYQQLLSLLQIQKDALIDIAESQNIEMSKTEKVTNRITIVVFFISIILTIGLGVILIRYTNSELNRLKQGAIIIGNGNFDYRIPIKNKDELGAVAESFNIMSAKMKRAMYEVHTAKTQADQANRAKSDFLANISHELRTPLNAIIGYSEMMLEDLQRGEIDQDEQAKDLVKVLYAGRHLLNQINDVLDFSKIESGNMTIYKEAFNPNQILQEVINTIRPLAKKGENQLFFDNSQTAPNLYSDITKFRQIFFNLLSNACKFTQHGDIHLQVLYDEAQPERVQFVVSDTGIGMNEEQLSVVFDPFIQADTSTTRRYGGTGLGLALCKQYCELVDAKIHARSEPNKGSQFYVEFATLASQQQSPSENASVAAAI
ncbi:HAMP domain-containing histidine kinase [Dasania sp. GY-MA-18]|uniref:histidine kinase n=1 Tax=Dasania phycosphaerae TaxID=2950436 RepID=A0A9J6RKZ6_9GAMM|nr:MULTISPECIES: HAMP domain-containing sensor histidine kinase [Dasania]MCR8922741.1 HAMP domain-containing histidine kinase [Dasania sp. GY-MA-18]MCZ0865171.1 HAMP domain-containing sensor histidine kinase [Dasania phycosphaerae]MCZ0868897.1 HAMP domain-containing sensor histidine kinase [Dasania phycosphaerae]